MFKQMKLWVTSDTKNAEAGMKRVDDSIKNTVKSLALATAGLIAMKKGFDFMKGSIDLAMKQEQTFRSLQSAVELTGKSWGGAKSELDVLFASLQKTTKYGDTDSAQVLQQLTTLSGDYEQSVKALPVTLDMASSGLFDMSSASRYVGMALSGNVEMLGRFIPELKSTVSPQLKLMSATEKTAFALDVLKKKFGGLAEKEMNTASAQWQQFKNYWGDVREEIGDRFLPLLNDVAGRLTELFTPTYQFQIRDARVDFETLAILLQNNAENTDIYKDAQKKLNEQFSDTLGTLDDQITKYGSLALAIVKMRDELIIQQQQQLVIEEQNELVKKAAKLRNEATAEIVKQAKAEAELLVMQEAAQRVLDEYNEKNNTSYTIEGRKGNVIAFNVAQTHKALGLVKDKNKAYFKSLRLLAEAEEKEKEIAGHAKTYNTVLNNILIKDEEINKEAKEHLETIKKIVTEYGEIGEIPEILTPSPADLAVPSTVAPLAQTPFEILYGMTQEEMAEAQEQMAEAQIGQAMALGGQLVDLARSYSADKMNAEIEALRRTNEYKNATAETQEKMEENIRKKYATKMKALFIADKVLSLSKIYMSTAEAVMKATALLRPDLATYATIMGGIQAGIVLAQPAPSFAQGGDFIVPQGYPNDSYPIMVESGERVQITPTNQVSNLDAEILSALNQIISKPIANTVVFDDIEMSRYVERGGIRRSTI